MNKTNRLRSAKLLVKCLENEGVEYIFGIPGEENIGVMDALLDSNIRFIITRHEQGAAFMAEIWTGLRWSRLQAKVQPLECIRRAIRSLTW